MKATYIAPETEVRQMEVLSIIAASIQISDDTASSDYEGGCDVKQQTDWNIWQ